MTKAKKPPVMVTCARCGKSTLKSESCYVRFGKHSHRRCQNCARELFGEEPRKL